MKNKRQRLVALQGVLIKLLETSGDKDETEFLYSILDKINNKIGE